MEKCENSPGRKGHPFWKSAIGSELTLELIVPPESQLQSLKIRVYASGGARSGTIYKVSAHYTSGQIDVEFVNEAEARHIVVNEWMRYYRDRTRITFVEHHAVDMSVLLNYYPLDSSSGESPRESSPRSPGRKSSGSPRDWLKKRLSLPLRLTRNSDGVDDVSSSTDTSPLPSPHSVETSPRVSRRWFLRGSPRSPRDSSPRSAHSSPRSAPLLSPKTPRNVSSPLLIELLDKTRERYAETKQ